MSGRGIRIEASALDLSLYEKLRGGRYRVERRGLGEPVEVGVYGSLRYAEEAVDQLVGSYEGSLEDYSVRRIGGTFLPRIFFWAAVALIGLIGVLALLGNWGG